MTRFQKSTSYLLWLINYSIRRSPYIQFFVDFCWNEEQNKDFLVLFLPNKDCNASWFIEEIQILPMFYKHPVSPKCHANQTTIVCGIDLSNSESCHCQAVSKIETVLRNWAILVKLFVFLVFMPSKISGFFFILNVHLPVCEKFGIWLLLLNRSV